MSAAVVADSSSDYPNYHASLTDGTTTIPIIFTDGRGEPNISAFKVLPYPRQALKTAQGDSKYSDLEPPYFAIAQDDWTGGRGNEDFESDQTRYYDGWAADTNKESGVVLAGRETYSTGYRNADSSLPGNLTYVTLVGSVRYYATSFSASASYTTYQCEMWVRRVGSPGNLTVEIWSNSGSDPGSKRAGLTVAADTITTDILSKLYAFVWTGTTAITSGTTYWVVIYGAATDDSSNFWQAATNTSGSGKYSSNGSSWSPGSSALYYRITPTPDNFIGKFFEYKRGLYMVTQPDDGGNSALYINGDRGAADDNSGDLTYLEDASKSWTNDEWANCIVLITKGPGSDENQNWRTISGNDSNSLEVSPDWNITHTTNTEYVILGSSKWTSIVADLGDYVVDVAVAGENIYFARGESASGGSNPLYRYRYYNNSGTWTSQNTTENVEASHLLAIRHSDEGDVVYGAQNENPEYGVCIWKGIVPTAWGDLYYKYADFVQSDEPWDSLDITNVTQTKTTGRTRINIAGGFTTGLAAVKNLDEPLDITHVDELGIKIRSSVACAAGTELELCWDDVEDLGIDFLPDKVFRRVGTKSMAPTAVYYERRIYGEPPTQAYYVQNEGTSPTYNAMPLVLDGTGLTQEEMTIETDDHIVVGYDKPFNSLKFDIVTPNVTSADLTLFTFDGDEWTQQTDTDGTASGGVPLAQDGTITWTRNDPMEPCVINGTEAYWVFLAWSAQIVAAASANIKIGSIMVQHLNDTAHTPNQFFTHPVYKDLKNLYDGNSVTEEVITLVVNDYICVGCSSKFNKIDVDLTSVNTKDATLAAYYFDGADWTQPTGFTDGTKSGADPFAQDGNITFEPPYDWELTTINGTKAYWLKIYTDTSLDADQIHNQYTCVADDFRRIPGEFEDLTSAYDGTHDAFLETQEQFVWSSTDAVYIGHGTKFNQITVTLDDNVNNNASTLAAYYTSDTGWTALSITDNTANSGATMGYASQDKTVTWTIPEDWVVDTVNGSEAYWVRLSVTSNLDEVDYLNFRLNRSNYSGKTNNDIGTLAANTWEWKTIEFTPKSYPIPDESTIKSVGLNVASDQGAQVIDIAEVALISENIDSLLNLSVFRLPSSHRINGMEAYSGNVDDPISNPWIFTESGVYELQTQNDDQIVAVPLKELGALQSSENGLGHTVSGTYLYFNVGEKIERYYNRTLDDVGPDRDEGLPDNRPGIPISMISYPGRVYTAIDANTGTSSVLTLRGDAWSEVYRAPRTSQRIKSIYIQAIPGTNVDRLWISMGSDVLWVPVSLHPYNETDFTFQHESYLITSWIYAGMQDVRKLWKSLKVFSENVTSTRFVDVDYQLDTDTTWTEIGGFSTAPVQERDIASTIPSGRRIRYRIRFYTRDVSETPRLKAIVTEGVAFVPVKNQYAMTFTLARGLSRIDLEGVHDDSRTPSQDYTTLLGWANTGNVLTLATQVPMADSKTVFIDPLSITPIRIVPDEDEELYVCQLTAIEV